MKFVSFSGSMKSNDAALWEFTMVFRESFLRQELEKPIVKFEGLYIRLASESDALINVGTIFSEPEAFFMTIDRQKFLQLLDQLEFYENHQELRPIYLIKSFDEYLLTSKFPTQFAQFKKENNEYILNFCDDLDLELLAKFLIFFKKLHDMESFLQDNDFDIDDINWELGGIILKGFGNEVRLVNREGREIKIEIKDLIRLMKEWQALLNQEPQEIYLVLENAEYRLTTEYTPEY